MKKGYIVEVINREEKKSEFLHFKDEESARKAMIKKGFCVLKEWAQFPEGLGDYTIEIARVGW